jgi:hypothetical protein
MPLANPFALLFFLLSSPVPQLPHAPPEPLIPPFKLPAQTPPTADSLHDNSDWFSLLRPTGNEEGEGDESLPVQERQIPRTNFRILGIDLSSDFFKAARQKFGQIHQVERGDAHYGRTQACYVSATGKSKIYLIFEGAEVDTNLYLFTGGPDWYGSDRCIPSRLVSARLATASGLRLGLSPAQVVAVLGKPSRRSQSELIYELHATKKMSARERADFLRANPTLTKNDVDRFASYDWSAGISAKFTDAKLTFLSISTGETN